MLIYLRWPWATRAATFVKAVNIFQNSYLQCFCGTPPLTWVYQSIILCILSKLFCIYVWFNIDNNKRKLSFELDHSREHPFTNPTVRMLLVVTTTFRDWFVALTRSYRSRNQGSRSLNSHWLGDHCSNHYAMATFTDFNMVIQHKDINMEDSWIIKCTEKRRCLVHNNWKSKSYWLINFQNNDSASQGHIQNPFKHLRWRFWENS